MKTPDIERWLALWRSAELSGDAATRYEQLVTLYSESHRHYHNLRHIAECLKQFDSARHLAVNPLAVELAIWFHDVIYDSRAHDNEQRSAELARAWLGEAKGGEQLIGKVCELILATRHAVAPSDPDSQLMVDVDLSILGQNETAFQQYEQWIRQEYLWVPEVIFAAKRAEILKGFLMRDRIYATQPFNVKYEKQARLNLERSIRHLQQFP